MDTFLARAFENLADRITGPMMLRLILQPAIATLLAIIDGLDDAKRGKTAYFWTVLSDRSHRHELLSDGWKHVGKVFSIAFVLDGIYQWIALRWFYPGEAALVAVLLAIVPYVLVRSAANRLAHRTNGRGPTDFHFKH